MKNTNTTCFDIDASPDNGKTQMFMVGHTDGKKVIDGLSDG